MPTFTVQFPDKLVVYSHEEALEFQLTPPSYNLQQNLEFSACDLSFARWDKESLPVFTRLSNFDELWAGDQQQGFMTVLTFGQNRGAIIAIFCTVHFYFTLM